MLPLAPRPHLPGSMHSASQYQCHLFPYTFVGSVGHALQRLSIWSRPEVHRASPVTLNMVYPAVVTCYSQALTHWSCLSFKRRKVILSLYTLKFSRPVLPLAPHLPPPGSMHPASQPTIPIYLCWVCGFWLKFINHQPSFTECQRTTAFIYWTSPSWADLVKAMKSTGLLQCRYIS